MTGVMCVLGILCCVGCTDAARIGVTDGITSALAAIVEGLILSLAPTTP